MHCQQHRGQQDPGPSAWPLTGPQKQGAQHAQHGPGTAAQHHGTGYRGLQKGVHCFKSKRIRGNGKHLWWQCGGKWWQVVNEWYSQ